MEAEGSRCSKGMKGADVGERESGLPSGKGESEMKNTRAAAEMTWSVIHVTILVQCDKILWEKVHTTSTHNSHKSNKRGT